MDIQEDALSAAQEIIRIATTSVLDADSRDEMIREVIVRELKPTGGEPALEKLIAAGKIIALLGYTLGAVMDDAKGSPEPEPLLRRRADVDDELRGLDD